MAYKITIVIILHKYIQYWRNKKNKTKNMSLFISVATISDRYCDLKQMPPW